MNCAYPCHALSALDFLISIKYIDNLTMMMGFALTKSMLAAFERTRRQRYDTVPSVSKSIRTKGSRSLSLQLTYRT